MLTIIVCCTIFSCSKPINSTVNTAKNKCPNGVVGTLTNMTGLDGCSWIIKLENGKNLEPINLKSFDITLQDGKKIWISYTPLPNAASICMLGSIVRIDCISDYN